MFILKFEQLKYILSLVILHSTGVFSQSNANEWSFTILNTLYVGQKFTPSEGREALPMDNVSSWEVAASKQLGAIIDTNVFITLQLGYGRNNFAYDVDIRQSDYPFLRDNWQSRNKQNIHAYWVFGVSGEYFVKPNFFISFGILNRIYRSARSGFTAESFIPTSNVYKTVLRAESKSRFTLFCPDFRVSIGYRLRGRLRNLALHTSVSLAPKRIIEGSFTYFPEVSGYTSSGTFNPRQSFVATGISWQFN